MKGVKRDPSAFPELSKAKDAKWDKFRRHCLATAHAQQVHEVFDTNHSVLTGSDDATVYKLKKDFVYFMIVKNIKTLKGMEIVKDHEDTRDTQQVFADLVAHYTTSTPAPTRAHGLFEYITVNTIPENWRESLEKSINTWKDWVREYNLIATTKMDYATQLVHQN